MDIIDSELTLFPFSSRIVILAAFGKLPLETHDFKVSFETNSNSDFLELEQEVNMKRQKIKIRFDLLIV